MNNTILISLVLTIISFSTYANEWNHFEEAVLLENYAKYVEKVEGGYKIRCKNGKSHILRNVISPDSTPKQNSVAQISKSDDGIKNYIFDDYFDKIGYFGFQIGYYEWDGYDMVNIQNCSIFELDSKPHISPNQKVMVVDNYNEMDGGNLYIFDINPNEILNPIKRKKEFLDLAVNFHSWIDSSNARLEGSYLEQKPQNFILHFDDVTKDWILQPTSEIFSQKTSKKEIKIDQKRVAELQSDKKFVLK